MLTNNNTTNIYLNECFTLARTMTIKLHEAAIAMNKYVSYKTGNAVVGDMSSWKYYLNVCGEYHSIDNHIQIVSLDTQQKIDFHKSNWINHPYTREQYAYGSRRYKDLIQQNPAIESFVISSLFPATMDKAVSEPSGYILAYDQSLVQENEYTLIAEVQSFLYNFTRRWYNPGYALLHDLYLGTFYVLMMNAVYMKIVSARMARCHTDQAHDFHIKSHLASHHWLDENYNALNIKQLHWLYRNINYISRNAGQKQTFGWLVENIFEERQLPLYEYVMKHNLNSDIDASKPVPVMNRLPLTSYIDLVSKSVGISTTLKNTETLAPENIEYNSINEKVIPDSLSDSLADTQKTKILECSVDNLKTANLYSIEETLLSHWIAYSALGQYNPIVEIQAPGSTVYTNIHAKDAAFIYLYCLIKIHYPDMYNSVNSIALDGIYVAKPDDVSRLNAKIPQSTLSNEDISKLYGLMPEYRRISSVYDFTVYCNGVKDGMTDQWNMWLSQPGTYRDVAMQTAALLRQRTVKINLKNVNILQLMANVYIDTEKYTKDDYQTLADLLQNSFVGSLEDSNTKIRKIQKSMIDIMLKLSSYSIQIANNSTSSTLLYVPTSLMKLLSIQHGSSSEKTIYDIGPTDTQGSVFDNTGYASVDPYKKTTISEHNTKSRMLENSNYRITYLNLESVNTKGFTFVSHQDSTTVYKDSSLPFNYFKSNSELFSSVLQSPSEVKTSCQVILTETTTFNITNEIATRCINIDNSNHLSAVANYGLVFMALDPDQRALEIDNLLT